MVLIRHGIDTQNDLPWQYNCVETWLSRNHGLNFLSTSNFCLSFKRTTAFKQQKKTEQPSQKHLFTISSTPTFNKPSAYPLRRVSCYSLTCWLTYGRSGLLTVRLSGGLHSICTFSRQASRRLDESFNIQLVRMDLYLCLSFRCVLGRTRSGICSVAIFDYSASCR